MQNTKKGKKLSHRISSIVQKRKKRTAGTQLKARIKPISFDSVSYHKRFQLQQAVPASCSTNGFNTSGLRFSNKLGFEVLKAYGANIEFSKEEKIRALMTYNCLKHYPGFVDKSFDNISDAICHVSKEASRLLNHSWGFTSPDSNFREDETIPRDYGIQIIYDEFDAVNGRWGSYCDIDACSKHDRRLRKAFYMCMKLIFGFGFTAFEGGDDFHIQSLEDWYQWKKESALDEIHHNSITFFEEYGREFNPKCELDRETKLGEDILKSMNDSRAVDDVVSKHEKYANSIMKRIRSTEVDIEFMKKVAAKYKDTEPGSWISHIIMLHEQNFNVLQYTAEAFKDIYDVYDSESIMPTSCYGFVYDGDDMYAEDMNDNYNDYVGNFCVLPFAITKTITNDGRIFETPDVPLAYWIKNIFKFSFTTYKDEIDRQLKAKSLIDIIC